MENYPVCAVILAAGTSNRMGQSKQLVDLNGKYMLERVVENVISHPFDEIHTIIGHHAELIMNSININDSRFKWVLNHNYNKGQSTSFQLAFENVKWKNHSVMIFLGDQPIIKMDTISLLLNQGITKIENTRTPFVIRPLYENKPGHPVFWGNFRKLDFSGVNGDTGGRHLMEELKEKIVIPTTDANILFDVDTPQDYRRALSLLSGEN